MASAALTRPKANRDLSVAPVRMHWGGRTIGSMCAVGDAAMCDTSVKVLSQSSLRFWRIWIALALFAAIRSIWASLRMVAGGSLKTGTGGALGEPTVGGTEDGGCGGGGGLGL